MEELQKLVQQTIDNYFPFLQSFGFKDLKEQETYFLCPWYYLNNGLVELSIQSQGELSLLHLCIDQYDFKLLDSQNTKFIQIETQFNHFSLIAYNKENVREAEKTNALSALKELSIEWLTEMKEVLLRHTSVFSGDLELLKKNYNIKREEERIKKVQKRIEDGIFTLEYYQFPEDEIDPFYDENCPYNCTLDFSNLDEVKHYLEKHQEIRIYRIFDSHMIEITISNNKK